MALTLTVDERTELQRRVRSLNIRAEDARRVTFAELSARSNQVANWLREQGVARGDRIIVMLGNQVELWETMLGIIKLGAVIMPTTTAAGPADLRDRIERGARASSSSTPPTPRSSTTFPGTTGVWR